jgi:glutathione S-transferase
MAAASSSYSSTSPPSSVAPAAAIAEWGRLAEIIPQPDATNGAYISVPTKVWEADRLYGKFEKKDIRVVLYRDAAYWCPYCIRIQLLLERKQIPYTLIKENMRCYGKKSAAFLQLVPSGLLPVVKIDGRVITESLDIMFEIEQQFPGAPYLRSLPVDDNDKMQAFHRYVRLERVMAGAWLNMLRKPQLRPQLGVDQFSATMDLVEGALGEFAGAFFLSTEDEGPGFVDILFAGFLERIRSSAAYWRNLDILAGRRQLAAWFASMEAWTPFGNHRSDDKTHILALPPQFGSVNFLDDRAELSTLIDRRRSLLVLNDGPEGAAARLTAAAAMVRNAELIVADAVRGVKGGRGDTAAMDVAFRVAAAVLADPATLEDAAVALLSAVPERARKLVAEGMRFERERCCTPRDMPVLAMEQFAGAMNWAASVLDKQEEGVV